MSARSQCRFVRVQKYEKNSIQENAATKTSWASGIFPSLFQDSLQVGSVQPYKEIYSEIEQKPIKANSRTCLGDDGKTGC